MTFAAIAGTALATWIAYQWVLFTITERKVRHIPTVGPDGFISSYIAAWKYMFSGKDAIHEGYEKYRGSVFKVPTLSTANRWLIVASGPNMIEEIRKATEDELSQHDASFESFQRDYILRDKGPMLRNMGHNIVRVVRGPLTKSFPLRFEELKEEIGLSLGANIPPTEEWSTVPFYPKALSIVAQTSNRLFVGLPLCRDSDYCQIHKDTTIAFFTGTQSLNMLPAFLRPLGGRLFTKVHRSHEETAKRLASVIRERLEMEKTHGKDWEGKPDDLISWFLDVTSEEENKTLESLALGIMFINMAAIHTTSLTLTLCLFELVSRQEYMEPLRAEVEEVVEEHGWSKESMTRMQKLDSFMKESVRFAGVAAAFVERQSKTDYKLSDGTVIPKGFRVTAAASPMNSDSELYEDAKTFDGFRFAQGGDPRSQSLVTLSRDFLLFGIGRNACPGRFFAVNEVKAILANILLNYDMELPKEGAQEGTKWVGPFRVPNPKAEILFRKRQGRPTV